MEPEPELKPEPPEEFIWAVDVTGAPVLFEALPATLPEELLLLLQAAAEKTIIAANAMIPKILKVFFIINYPVLIHSAKLLYGDFQFYCTFLRLYRLRNVHAEDTYRWILIMQSFNRTFIHTF